ncbi:MAG: diguanylate cyclase [Candidatus Omnitrophota bacterium]
MKNEQSKTLIWISLGMGVSFWFFEAAVHSVILRERSYLAQIVSADRNEIWMRLLVAALFIVFGFYAQFIVKKRQQAKNETKFADEEVNQVFRPAAYGMRIVDKDFNVLTANETFCNLSGVSKERAKEKKCYEVLPWPMCHTLECPLALVLSGRERVELELKTLNEKLLESNEKLKQLTLRDAHTGLYNHRYLCEIIEKEFNRAKRTAEPLSVMMMDVDYFKSINDVYGHQFGDIVLKQLAEQLSAVVRKYDSVVRYGGEEFIIISPGINKSAAASMGHRILERVNEYGFGDEKHTIKMKISIAIASYFEDEVKSGMELVDFADHVLRKIKEEGGNKVYSSSDIEKDIFPVGGKNKSVEDVKYLKGKIYKLIRRANQSLIEAIFAFAKTAQLKDYYKQEHIENTVRYAAEIAESLFLPLDEVERVRQAAVLHDLGKIGIDEHILLKRDKLTSEEYEKVKQHPRIGADVIRPVPFLQAIIPLVLYHHEKWNGQGSFYGLKGEEIPIGARIVAVTDVYQALISDRPYRKAYSKEEAINLIKINSHTAFDPKVVDTFLDILNKE